LPRFPEIPEVTLFPGQKHLVELKVDRRGYKGPIELRVQETKAGLGGAGFGPGPGGFPGKAGGPPPPGAPPMAAEAKPGDVVVVQPITIPPASDTAHLVITAKSEAGQGVHGFELTARVERAPGQMLVPVEEDGGPAGPPGGMPGGMPGGPGLKDEGAGPGPRPREDEAAGPGAKPGAAVLPNRMVRRFLVRVRDLPRETPPVLALASSGKEADRLLQIDVVRAGVLGYLYQPRGRRIWTFAGGPRNSELAERVAGKRLVVVSASFPYREQLEHFRKALRAATIEDLFARPETTPRFLGLNVLRREVHADQVRGPWVPLYEVDADTGTIKVYPSIKQLLSTMVYDTEQLARLDSGVIPGLVTPLPQLVGRTYPRLNLVGIEHQGETGPWAIDPVAPQRGMGGRPIGPPGGPKLAPGGDKGFGGEAKLRLASINMFPREFGNRLDGRWFPFHPYGLFPGEQPDQFGPGPVGPRPEGKGLMQPPGLKPQFPGGPEPGGKPPERCLVRFVDVDPMPGRTYEYSIQVGMANPNHGKHGAVRIEADARRRCLLSKPVITRPVSIGPDWDFYVVDQLSFETTRTGIVGHIRPIDRNRPVPSGMIPVQIQRWTDELEDQGEMQKVGGWVIAERLLVERGEVIGRLVEVEVPVWDMARGTYVLGHTIRSFKVKKSIPKRSVAVDFVAGDALVLADFWGEPNEEGYVEALAVSPDGELTVRNACHDSRPAFPSGRQRQERYEQWRSTLLDARFGNTGSGPVAPGKPGSGKRGSFKR
jgi:hypothetical protein